MNDESSIATSAKATSFALAGNGATMILVGLLSGLAVNAAPYPRLMLTAHIQFLVNGMVSVLAAVLLASSLSVVSTRGAATILWGHLSTWAVPVAEVIAAITGAKRALPLAAGQAGAPGAAAWIEIVVLICHIVPSVLLIAAWAALVAGIRAARAGHEPVDARVDARRAGSR